MAAEATVYSGAGKVTLAVPTSCLDIVTQKVMPEVMTGSFGNMLHVRMHTVDKDAVAIGPGLGRTQEAKEMVRNVVHPLAGTVVIDADGL
uniref:NAD(P)H-hydrate dehydratase n=1 Tax=Veillonella magna TaxID=464322 RepID=UPI00402B0484